MINLELREALAGLKANEVQATITGIGVGTVFRPFIRSMLTAGLASGGLPIDVRLSRQI